MMIWTEICKKYKDKWVLLDDVRIDEDNMQITEGKVLYWHPDKDQVYKNALELRPQNFAIEYTGEFPKELAVML